MFMRVKSLWEKNLKERHIYLFNDLLVCTKKKGKLLKIDFIEPLATLRVADVNDGEFRQFRLYSSSKEYVLISDDKYQWIKIISDTIKAMKSDTLRTVDENKPSSHNHIEESSREYLMNRIFTWSKMDDPHFVLREIKDLATVLDKYKATH